MIRRRRRSASTRPRSSSVRPNSTPRKSISTIPTSSRRSTAPSSRATSTMGQTVAASFQTPTLFLIATDLTKMQVDTNVSESDIGALKARRQGDFHRRTLIPIGLSRRGHPDPPVAADRAERRHLSMPWSASTTAIPRCMPGMTATVAVRRRSARQRAARARPGPALYAGAGRGSPGLATAAAALRHPGATRGSGFCARASRCPSTSCTGLDDDTYHRNRQGRSASQGDQVIVGEAIPASGRGCRPARRDSESRERRDRHG